MIQGVRLRTPYFYARSPTGTPRDLASRADQLGQAIQIPLGFRSFSHPIQRTLHAETTHSHRDVKVDLRGRYIFVAGEFLNNTEGLEAFWTGSSTK